MISELRNLVGTDDTDVEEGFSFQPFPGIQGFVIPNRYENVIDVTEVKTGDPGATVSELVRGGWEVVGILKGITQLVKRRARKEPP